MIDRQLAHYRILEKLGQGGMGEVYLAEDTKLDRRVALKLLPDDFAADPARVERFRLEGRALAALDHPNIVTVHKTSLSIGVGLDIMCLSPESTEREMTR
jgi:serine/threonine protein kinase